MKEIIDQIKKGSYFYSGYFMVWPPDFEELYPVEFYVFKERALEYGGATESDSGFLRVPAGFLYDLELETCRAKGDYQKSNVELIVHWAVTFATLAISIIALVCR